MKSYLVASLDIAVLVFSLSLVEGALAVVVSHAVLVLIWLRGELLLFVGGGLIRWGSGSGLILPRWRGSGLVGLCGGGDIDRGAVRPGGGGHEPEQEQILKRRSVRKLTRGN